MERLDFSKALILAKGGAKIQREGWNGKDQYIKHVDPFNDFGLSDEQVAKVTSATLSPYLAIKTADNKFLPWLPSQSDLLANDWMVALIADK